MKFTSINSSKLALTGVVVVIGLTLALLYIGYYVFTKETQRTDNQPALSSVPVEPDPVPVSPEAEAPSSPATAGGDNQ
ncbi:MAG: hypothetical protein ABIQ54_01985 [Gammaproteobacteria bacterium]